MNSKEKEIMLIAQEECAEVTQAISKCFRFGFDSEYEALEKRNKLERWSNIFEKESEVH